MKIAKKIPFHIKIVHKKIVQRKIALLKNLVLLINVPKKKLMPIIYGLKQKNLTLKVQVTKRKKVMTSLTLKILQIKQCLLKIQKYYPKLWKGPNAVKFLRRGFQNLFSNQTAS